MQAEDLDVVADVHDRRHLLGPGRARERVDEARAAQTAAENGVGHGCMLIACSRSCLSRASTARRHASRRASRRPKSDAARPRHARPGARARAREADDHQRNATRHARSGPRARRRRGAPGRRHGARGRDGPRASATRGPSRGALVVMADCPLVTAESLDALARGARPARARPLARRRRERARAPGAVNGFVPRFGVPSRRRSAPRARPGSSPWSSTTRRSRSTSTGPRTTSCCCSHDRLITYSPKVFIPLTKLCRDVCHYCTFAQPPAPRRAGVHARGRGARGRARRRRGRLPRGALHARGQARAPLPRGTRGARRARVRDDDRVPRAHVRARPRRDRAPPAREPRRHDARGAGPPPDGLGLAGDHARDGLGAALAEGHAAPRLAGQAPRAAPGDDPPRRRACRSRSPRGS